MAKKKKPENKVYSLRVWTNKAGVNYMKVYNFLRDFYKTNNLTAEEKISLINALYDNLNPILKKLGFFMEIKRISTDPSPAEKPLP